MDSEQPVITAKVTQELIRKLRTECQEELTGNILPYWSGRMVDHVHGGFYGRRDGYDNLVENADKGIILNARILWTFSQASRLVSPSHLPIATRAFDYIRNFFLDQEKGGFYWMVDYRGVPVNTRKQIYAQAFVIYAMSEYYLASGNKESLSIAVELFDYIEKFSFDEIDNGYLEAFDRNWKLEQDLRLSDKDANEKKTMNTHLHVLEAYTNLYRCWTDRRLERQLKNLVDIFAKKIISDQYHFNLFFDEKWNVRSHEISYGHDIEGSWLLLEAAEVLRDQNLLEMVQLLALKIVNVTVREGMDSDGGIMNESHDTDKHWWPQAEALVGFVNAWQLTSDVIYLEKTVNVWNFIREKLIDRTHGEWYWRVNRSGKVNFEEDKAGPWKCPYHNGRAMFELLNRLPK